MNKKYLVDTNIIIDFFRGSKEAEQFITENCDNIIISVITIAELYAGVRGKKEEEQLKGFLSLFDLLPFNNDLAIKSGYLKNQYYKSHNSGLADCMIAATALAHDMILVTNNFKHFPMVEEKIRLDQQ